MSRPPVPPEAGLTIVELLIALALFMILITVILPTLPQMFGVNRGTLSSQAVTGYAKGVIEQTGGLWLTRDPSPTAADPYPALVAGTLPSTLPAPPSGVTCQPPSSVAVGTAAPVSRRRLTVSCTSAVTGTLTFVSEIGRPQ